MVEVAHREAVRPRASGQVDQVLERAIPQAFEHRHVARVEVRGEDGLRAAGQFDGGRRVRGAAYTGGGEWSEQRRGGC